MLEGALCLHISGGVVGAVAAMSVKRISSILVSVYRKHFSCNESIYG
jgi:hypothetical protein